MISGILDEFFGVPTHPLAIHAPVVLVPIGAVIAVVLAWRADWRRRVGWWTLAGVAVLVAMLFVAKQSGEALEASGNVLGDVDRHTDFANTTFTLSIVWLVITALLVARDWQVRRAAGVSLSAGAAPVARDVATTSLAALWAVAAIVTTIWLIRTGHAGATSRWVA